MRGRNYNAASYRGLLRTALDAGWTFCSFCEPAAGDKPLLLRHDVDYSMSMAVELARINASLGVRGTFFLLLRSEAYNLLSPTNLEFARQLHQLGQWLGLHYPVPKQVASAENLVRLVAEEFRLIRSVLPDVQPVFAWHNPTAEVFRRFSRLQIAPYINAYDHDSARNGCYFSDSNMRNSVAQLESVLRRPSRQPLQLLLHPFNWIAGGSDMLQVLAGTWKRIIRDCEVEIATNGVYRAALPSGMPESLLHEFAQRWLKTASLTSRVA